jgi:hypothetical protein
MLSYIIKTIQMIMFLSQSEQQLSEEYLSNGYVIKPVADFEALA